MTSARPVIAVTGLVAEARIAAAPGVATVSGGGDAGRLAVLLEAALIGGARGVISFGIAGGLRPGLKAGTLVIGTMVGDGRTQAEASPEWIRRLVSALPDAVVGSLAGVDQAVCGVDRKTALHHATGAVAVDMETHVAARLAMLHGIPFAALRVIADPADRIVPYAATLGMRPDGSTDAGAVLRALVRTPGDLPALVRTALDARLAFAALKSAHIRLPPLLGFGGIDTDAHPSTPMEVLDRDGSPALSGAARDLHAESF